MEWFLIWPLFGIIGFALYCSNGNTRPKKWYLLCGAFCTHTLFGFIGLMYGLICFAGRHKRIKGSCQ